MELDIVTGALDVVTGAGGATAFGLAVALWVTHPADEPWGAAQVTFLGSGIGAATTYFVGWLDLIKTAVAG